MDDARYSEDTRRLMEEGSRLAAAKDRKCLSVLSRLKKIADQQNDNALRGYAAFYRAGYAYETGDYPAYQEYLRQAVHDLFRSDQRELLARALNFFGTDAYVTGCYDIAYSYYMSGLQFIKDNTASAVRSYIIFNTANLLYLMKRHKDSRAYYRKCIPVLKKDTDNPLYHRNLLIAFAGDGLNSLSLGDIRAAVKTAAKIDKHCSGCDPALFHDALPYEGLFRARLLLATGDETALEKQIGALAKQLQLSDDLGAFAPELQELCRELMRAGKKDHAGRLIHAADAGIAGSGNLYALHLFTGLKADYYEACGDKKKLLESLVEQHTHFLAYEKEHKKMYHYSANLFLLVSEMKEEENRMLEENRRLRTEAMTDALCGIPNRYAMDETIGTIFERAYASGSNLGVGLFDINGFKHYNDTYGHQAGDACLAAIGQVLKNLMQDERIFCARYGGDEFLVVYEGMSDDEILRITDRLHAEIAKIPSPDNAAPGMRISISQGICNDVPAEKMKPWDFLSEADDALYSLKHRRVSTTVRKRTVITRLSDIYR